MLVYSLEVINSVYMSLPSTAPQISLQERLWRGVSKPWIRVGIKHSIHREPWFFLFLSIMSSYYGTYASCLLVVALESFPPASSTGHIKRKGARKGGIWDFPPTHDIFYCVGLDRSTDHHRGSLRHHLEVIWATLASCILHCTLRDRHWGATMPFFTILGT